MVFITRDLPREAIERTLAAFEGAVEERSSSESPPREQEAAGTRHDFLVAAGSVAAATAFSGSARAVMRPEDKFDLLIKGGDVLDPSQSPRGRRDIGIRYGIIEAVGPEIPAERALRVLDASGKLVTPGLAESFPKDLTPRRFFSPYYGGPRVRIHLPPAGSLLRT
jgi:hypothetical protein